MFCFARRHPHLTRLEYGGACQNQVSDTLSSPARHEPHNQNLTHTSSPLIWELYCAETLAAHGVKSADSESGERPPPSRTIFFCCDLDLWLLFGFDPSLIWFCWQIPMQGALLTVEGSLLEEKAHMVSKIDPFPLPSIFQHVLCDFCISRFFV